MSKKEENQKTTTRMDYVKSIAWLIEATFRGFVAYELLTNRSNYIIVVAGVYALVTALMIVVTHFVNAHK